MTKKADPAVAVTRAAAQWADAASRYGLRHDTSTADGITTVRIYAPGYDSTGESLAAYLAVSAHGGAGARVSTTVYWVIPRHAVASRRGRAGAVKISAPGAMGYLRTWARNN